MLRSPVQLVSWILDDVAEKNPAGAGFLFAITDGLLVTGQKPASSREGAQHLRRCRVPVRRLLLARRFAQALRHACRQRSRDSA